MKKIIILALMSIGAVLLNLQSICQQNPIIEKKVNFNKVCFSNEKTGWILSLFPIGALLLTNDGGSTWNSIIIPNCHSLLNIKMINQKVGFIVGDEGTILRTDDGGKSWNPQYNINTENIQSISDINRYPGLPLNFYCVDFSNERVGFIVSNYGVIVKTVDGGEHWSANRIDGVGKLFSIHCVNENLIYAVGEGQQTLTTKIGGAYTPTIITDTRNYECLLKTENGGTTWTTTALPDAPWNQNVTDCRQYPAFIKIFFVSDNVGFLLDNHHFIYKTVDSGKSWIQKSISDAHTLTDIFFVNEYTGYVIGESGTIEKTTDGGKTWVKINSGTSETLNSIFFTNVNNGIIVGDRGTMLKTVNGSQSWMTSQWKGIYEETIWLHLK